MLLCNSLYGDPAPFKFACLYFLNCLILLVFCAISQAHFRNAYKTAELAKAKSIACERLLSMFCDGIIGVANDGDTVTKNDGQCDVLQRVSAGGCEKLSDLMAGNVDEVHRLHEAFLHSKASPVLFHSICSAHNGGFCSVDFFIVRQEEIISGLKARCPDCSHDFLVGVCIRRPFTCFHVESPLRTIADADEKCSEPAVQLPLSEVSAEAGPQHDTGSADNTRVSPKTSEFSQSLAGTTDSPEHAKHLAGLCRGEHWLIKPEELFVTPNVVLGKGVFGVVLAGSLHGTSVAINVPSSYNIASNTRSLTDEIRKLWRIRHRHIVLFIGACIAEEPDQLALVFEKVQGPSLKSFIRKPPRGPSTAERYRLVLDVCEALRYLHGQHPQVVHGHVKPDNIMVDEVTFSTPRAKLLDFGLTRLMPRNQYLLEGDTLPWIAPEVITGSEPHTSTDVFSFGHLLIFMMSGQIPCPEMTPEQIKRMARRGRTCVTVPRCTCYKVECEHLCKMCCAFKPTCRPSMGAVHDSILEWTSTLACPIAADAECRSLKPNAAMQAQVLSL